VKSRHFRFLIVLGSLSILGTASLQYYWFSKAFDQATRNFDLKVNQSLIEVARDIYDYNSTAYPGEFPIEKLSDNYYVVMINDHIDLAMLEALLERQFTSQKIETRFAYTVYDCANNQLVYSQEIASDHNERKKAFPKWDKDQYYFGVFFPDRQSHLIGDMSGWLALSLILVVVMTFFAYALFVIFQQKRLSEIRRDFVNNMTHELKTPLSTMKIASESLTSEQGLSERAIRFIDILQEEANKLEHHISGILSQAKGEKEGLRLKKEQTDITQWISSFVEKQKILHTGLQVDIEYQNVPPFIKMDVLQMTQVFTNLLDNTLKYSTKKSVEVSVKRLKKIIQIDWADEGNSIPEKYRKDLFKPFFRVPMGDKHDQKGFGLGLYYISKVMKAHKGSVRYLKQGSRNIFRLELPAI
jgi:two-component system phosphate regulon sensor histidine kinase PhoR